MLFHHKKYSLKDNCLDNDCCQIACHTLYEHHVDVFVLYVCVCIMCYMVEKEIILDILNDTSHHRRTGHSEGGGVRSLLPEYQVVLPDCYLVFVPKMVIWKIGGGGGGVGGAAAPYSSYAYASHSEVYDWYWVSRERIETTIGAIIIFQDSKNFDSSFLHLGKICTRFDSALYRVAKNNGTAYFW